MTVKMYSSIYLNKIRSFERKYRLSMTHQKHDTLKKPVQYPKYVCTGLVISFPTPYTSLFWKNGSYDYKVY